MLADSKAFSGFAVPDIEAAREFYGDTLGLNVRAGRRGLSLLTLHLAGDRPTLIYPKPDFEPATYTILNFPVDDVDAAVDELARAGCSVREVRGLRPGREGHRPRPGPGHRVVQGPGGEHPVGAQEG